VTEITDFGLIVLAVSGTVFVALLGMRVADRFSVPYAALFLVATVALTETFSSLDDIVSIRKVERLTVVALVVILFDGGSTSGSAASDDPLARFSHWASWEP
jgi:NhaP-type Na+/H+ and K+/H+ antiporter